LNGIPGSDAAVAAAKDWDSPAPSDDPEQNTGFSSSEASGITYAEIIFS